MGNTIASYDSQESIDELKNEKINWQGSGSKTRRKRHVERYPKALKGLSSSFLAEPVTSKSTERANTNATLSVSASESDDEDGREGFEVEPCNRDQKLRYAVSEMQGWRSHMEDKYLLDPKLSTSTKQEQLLKDHHIFAVFDGHGGDFASHFCGEHFVSTLIAQKDWQTYLKLSSKVSSENNSRRPKQESVIGLQLLKSALTSTFLELDVKLVEAQRERRLSQLSKLKDLVYSLAGHADFDVFRPGTQDHQRVMNFSKHLPESVPFSSVPLERSGSTGVVVLITPSHILCANAGDSRAILSKRSEEAGCSDVLPLSFDHKPTNDVELCRVEKDGGFVRTKRVDGDLAVSRGFGDFEFKNRGGGATSRDAANANGASSPSGDGAASYFRKNSLPKDHRVTVHPDIIVHTRAPNDDEFVVLACDGIWDRLSNRDCADLVRDLAYDEGEADVGLVCEEVIDTALELDSRDNMTCCVVFFPNAERDGTSTSLDIDVGGVLQRRMDREESWGSNSTHAKRAQLRGEERRRKKRDLIGLQEIKVPKSQVHRQRQQGGLHLSLDKEGGNTRSGRPSGSSSNKGKKQKSSRNSSGQQSRKSLLLEAKDIGIDTV